MTTLSGRYYYYLDFTDGKTEVQNTHTGGMLIICNTRLRTKFPSVAFANFGGVNIPTMADFKLTT